MLVEKTLVYDQPKETFKMNNEGEFEKHRNYHRIPGALIRAYGGADSALQAAVQLFENPVPIER